MVSRITQSGMERMQRLQVESDHPVVKNKQDMIALGILGLGILVLFVRYNRKQTKTE